MDASKPIIKTYAYAFNNGQTCQLGFLADQNGVQCIANIKEPLRFEEIEAEYLEWRRRCASDFYTGLPDQYKDWAFANFIGAKE